MQFCRFKKFFSFPELVINYDAGLMFFRRISLFQGSEVYPRLLQIAVKGIEIASHQWCNYRTKGATYAAALEKHQGKYDLQTEIQRITTTLGIPESDAITLIKKMPDVYKISTSKLKETHSVLQECGFNPEAAILECPKMTSLDTNNLKTRILIYMECGLYVQKNPSIIMQLRRILSQSPQRLKRQYRMDKSCNLVKEMKAKLNSPNTSWSPKDISDDNPLKVLRERILIDYLSQRLAWSKGTAERIITTSKIADEVVISGLPGVLDALLETWKLHRNVIYNRPGLLKHSEEHLISLYNTGKSLGLDYLPEIVRQQPPILRTTGQRLRELLQILEKYGLNKEVLRIAPELLLLTPATVDERLNTIENTPQLRVLKTNHRIGDIVYHLPKVFKNLDKLDSSYPEYSAGAPIARLVGSYKQFDHFLQVNVKRSTDFINFLAPYFPTKTTDEIAHQLHQHPHAGCSNMVITQETLQFLIGLNFHSDLIFSALPIALYPKDTVEEAIKELVESGEKDTHSVYFLHLVLYHIEKPFDWSGDGLFVGTQGKVDHGSDDVVKEYAAVIEY